MEVLSSYLTLSSRSLHSILAFPPPLNATDSRVRNCKMTTYARPSPPPVNTLPVELLSYIFTLGTHSTVEPQPSGESGNEPEGAPAFTTENVKMPLVLASVSRYWRRVALNTPRLWTSFCITLEMIHPSQDQQPSSSSSGTSSVLDTRHITSYLALSRHYPIDILIDARDQDWDFLEEEVTPDSQSYRPPFSVNHMQTVLSFFLPHLSRWRSLNILTDTWKPMQTAMQLINPEILQHGAPQLESLTLMRCNDFVSFSSEFEPKSLKSPTFLSNPSQAQSPPSRSLLPRLRYLSLRGVHVDWTSLGSALSLSKTGLYSLELCSHCPDVRPTLFELHNLLSSSPRLRRLVIYGSGPSFPNDIDEGTVDLIHHEFEGVLLPNLGSFTLGYRSALEGQTVLQLVNAPSLKNLVLEEATYPADPEVIDAGSLLTYLGTGEFHSVKERYLVAYDLPNHGFHYQVKTRKDSTSSVASTSTCVGSGIEIGGRLVEVDDDDETLVDFDTKPHPPFPLLENVVLKNVRTSSTQPIASFFSAVRNLKRLELVGMSMRPLYTLLPNSYVEQPLRRDVHSIIEESSGSAVASSSSSSAIASSSTAQVPPPPSLLCPHLRSISLQECNHMQLEDLNFILNNLVSDRKQQASAALAHDDSDVVAPGSPSPPPSAKCSLEDIEIQLGPNAPITSCKFNLQDGEMASIGDILDDHPSLSLQKDGVRIEVRRQVTPFSEDDDEDDESSSEEEMEGNSSDTVEGCGSQSPFSQGGTFNDPYFDAYYTGAPWLSAR